VALSIISKGSGDFTTLPFWVVGDIERRVRVVYGAS